MTMPRVSQHRRVLSDTSYRYWRMIRPRSGRRSAGVGAISVSPSKLRQASRLVGLTAVVLAASAAPAFAASSAGAAPELSGTGISRVGDDTRRLTVKAESTATSQGKLTFAHRAPAGISRFRGTITCLRSAPDGTVDISGTVANGQTASGVVLDGRDFAFTLETEPSDQSFSLPRFGAGLADCSGGRPELVPVTEGRLRLR